MPLGSIGEYQVNSPDLHSQFFEDILHLASKYRVSIYYKRKRDSHKSRFYRTSYTNILSRLNAFEHLKFVDPAVSPETLIRMCDSSISMCFTSTALFSTLHDTPSCYYDPTGLISKLDPAAHDILVITQFTQLEEWFKRVYSKPL